MNDYIVIEGNIGSGKTSLSKMLANEFNRELILERFGDNPFLEKFYEDKNRYAFQTELSFLADRHHQLKETLQQPGLFKEGFIADYYFAKSLVFASLNLPKDEFDLYRQLFEIIHHSLPAPSVIVYLYVKPQRLLANIRKRGRDFESNISEDYLESIHAGYLQWFKQNSRLPIALVDSSNLDFVANQSDYELLKSIILKKHEIGINRYLM